MDYVCGNCQKWDEDIDGKGMGYCTGRLRNHRRGVSDCACDGFISASPCLRGESI